MARVWPTWVCGARPAMRQIFMTFLAVGLFVWVALQITLGQPGLRALAVPGATGLGVIVIWSDWAWWLRWSLAGLCMVPLIWVIVAG